MLAAVRFLTSSFWARLTSVKLTLRMLCSSSRKRGRRMDAPKATAAWQVGGNDAITSRIGVVALPLGMVVILVSEYFHPSREDPMDNLLGRLSALTTTLGAAVGKHLGQRTNLVVELKAEGQPPDR